MEAEYDYTNNTDYPSYDDDYRMLHPSQIFRAVVYIFPSLAGLVGDIIIIILIATKRHLRSITNVYILQLLLSDLLSVCLFPIGVLSRLEYFTWYDSIGYNVIRGFDYASLFLCTPFLVLISIDCYLATRPRQNSLQHRWKVLKITSALLWVIGLVYIAVLSFSLDKMIHEYLRSMYHYRYTDIQPFLSTYFALIPFIICWIYVSFIFPVKSESVEANESESVEVKAPPRALVLALVSANTALFLPYYIWEHLMFVYMDDSIHMIIYFMLYLSSPVTCFLCLFLQKDLRQAVMNCCQSRPISNIPLENL